MIAHVSLLRDALFEFDPELPGVEVTRIMACGLGLTVADAPFSSCDPFTAAVHIYIYVEH
jgi:hypothetical protein